MTISYYRSLGAVDIEELGKPYDLKCTLDGRERHIEVKGRSMLISTVELTVNEVTHATNFQPTDLVVVQGIRWERDSHGSVSASGGALSRRADWVPTAEDLSAHKYAYLLPDMHDVELPSSS